MALGCIAARPAGPQPPPPTPLEAAIALLLRQLDEALAAYLATRGDHPEVALRAALQAMPPRARFLLANVARCWSGRGRHAGGGAVTEKKLREELRRVQEELRIARCELETSYEEFARRVREEEHLRFSNSLLCGDLERVKDKLARVQDDLELAKRECELLRTALLLAQELLALLRGAGTKAVAP